VKRVLAALAALLLTISFISIPAEAVDIDEVRAVIDSIPENWPEGPSIGAKNAVLMDAETGEILYAKNALDAAYPASTTKLMTALLTLEQAGLNDIVDFSFQAINIPSNSSYIGMRRGEQMVLKECLYGLLLPSANEVANALAEHVSGSIGLFVKEMNVRAFELGCVNTVFQNANGLHHVSHYTCAYDLALVMKACIANPAFLEISSAQSYVHHSDELLPKDIPMVNTNKMIRPASEYYNADVICGKTGHTDESGHNLVSYAERNGTKLIAVVLGCADGNEYVSTQSLFDYGFNYFNQMLPADFDQSLDMEAAYTSSPLQVPTPGLSLLHLDSSERILVPAGVTYDMLEKKTEKTDDGITLTYIYEGYPLGSVHLSYQDPVPADFYEVDEKTVAKAPTVATLAILDGRLLLLLGGLTALCILVILLIKYIFLPRTQKRPEMKINLTKK